MWLVYASASAVCFGMRGILYQWTSQKPLNRSLLLLGVYLCGTIIALSASLLLGQPWTKGSLFGILMGLFSYTSNAAMYKGFEVGKASIVAIFTALPPVVVTVCAYVLWGETFHIGQWAAFILIMFGIVMIRYSGNYSVRDLRGVQWAVLALFAFGITDVSSKSSTRLAGETFPTLAIMYAVGSLLFWISWLLSERKSLRAADHTVGAHESAATIETSASQTTAVYSTSRTLALGLLVGTTNISGMILILAAFRIGITGLVSAIIAMNVLLILLYARIVLKETFTFKEWTGIALAVGGILILKLAG